MALKTFNIEDEVYKTYSKHCKKQGISMSRRIENFLREEVLKIKKLDPKNIVENKEIAKEFREIGKMDEHPLKKYC